MLILIAESKTMAACDVAVSPGEYAFHRPAFDDTADDIMAALRGSTAEELSQVVKISPALARRLVQMIYDFPNKSTGRKAVQSYTGVVFRSLGYDSLSDSSRADLCGRVRIVSSLYGWLRPDDIIKPYRFDFTTALAPGGVTFARYWRDALSECLMRDLRNMDCGDVLDLLPGDAMRCIDLKRCADACRIWKVDFREVRPGGVMRTPNAGRLKTLRGRLLRQIASEGITAPEGLRGLSSDDYYCDNISGASATITFHTCADR